jgi:GT2 family glycosyltransferase
MNKKNDLKILKFPNNIAQLEKQVEAAVSYPGISIFHTDEIWVRNGQRVNAMKKHAKPDGWVYAASLPLCCVSPSSILLHRNVLTRCGVFDVDFFLYEFGEVGF